MEKILILGGTGFVGRELSKYLPNAVYFVRKTSNHSHLKGRKLFYGDILNVGDLIKASKGTDVIINLTGPSKQMGNINTDVIIKGTENIIKSAQENKVKRIINLSSMAAERKAIGPYGRAKKEADFLLKNSKLTLVNLKPTLIFDKEGSMFQQIMKTINFFPKIVPIIGKGTYKIQPIYLNDLCQAIIAATKLSLNPTEQRSYELGGPSQVTYRDFVKKILQAQGKQKHLINLPLNLVYFVAKLIPGFNRTTVDRAIETITINNSKSKKDLNLKLTSYEQALRKIFTN